MAGAGARPLASIVVERVATGRFVVRVAGELDAYTSPDLRECLTELLEERAERVAVDLADVTFVDSVALGVFAGAERRARVTGTEVTFCRASAPVMKTLELTGLSRFLTLE